jgi:conjugative relaxase-like TrwC/TraI family protein
LCGGGGVVTFESVQTTHKIAGTSAGGFATYLTSESDRGDYYAGHEDTDGGVAGEGGAGVGQSRWHGSPELLAGLGLSADGPVEHDDLLDLMNGVSPVTGEELRAAGGNGTRVAGIDLTFSAPKTVSALWAVSGPQEREQIERAHGNAVASALERVERDVELLRSREGGELRWERAQSILAAEFVHTSSRMTVDQERGGVPDPQLHSHVVVLGAERPDGRFAAVDSRELFRSARANGAWYRSELANQLGEMGLEVQGGTGRDGRYFELKGVPEQLSERWSARSKDIQKAAAKFRERYGRDPRAGELGSITVATRGGKSIASEVSVNAAWQAVGEEYGLSQEQAQSLFTGIDHSLAQSLTGEQARDLAKDLVRDVTKERSIVRERDLHARAYELSAGVCQPGEADKLLGGLVQSGELVELEGGLWTTRELREREQQTMALAESRAGERAAPVSEASLQHAQEQTEKEIGAPLSSEQRDALQTITGEGGVSILVGQAGTGKGVVLSTAADAWEKEGYQVIGTAIAGATAERLGADAKLEHAVNTSALLRSVQSGYTHLGPDTVVVMDEAGMADTSRLAALVEVTAERDSKLVLVGDQAQLPSIGAGGMFAELQSHVPTAELSEVHRANHEWEQEAWAQLREGQSNEALAAYDEHEQLHIADTREQAAERMVADWAQAREENPGEQTVMLTDASNVELEKINALAQDHRAQAGELGEERVELPDWPYGLATGDEVIFTAALNQPGEARVENGTLGKVANIGKENGTPGMERSAGSESGTPGTERNSARENGPPDTDRGGEENHLTIKTQGAHEREVEVNTSEFKDLRLSYAQHVYKAQGLTVNHAFVLTGGWQTDRERAYVALSRARERTDIYASHEDLGNEGMNTAAIETLAQAMSESNAKQPSITTPLAEREKGQGIEPTTDGLGPAADAVPAPGVGTGPPEEAHIPDTGGLGPGADAFPPPGAGAGPPSEPHTTSVGSLEQQGEQAQEREHESEVGRIMRESQEQRDRDREQDRDLGYGIE